MLNRLIQAAKIPVRRRSHRWGRTIKNMLRPVRTAAALVGAVSIDAVRPRSELVAENALLRQQLREATPYDSAPRFLIRDNDGEFGRDFAAAATSADIEVVPIPPRSPNLNAICERFLGGLRRECLDHVLILGEDHLRRMLAEWVGHFNGGRPHQGIGQRIPNQRQRPNRANPEGGRIVAFPVMGGLHHDYRRAA